MVINPGQTIVGLVGTGVMGKSMAGHFIQAGYEVHIYNRTKSKAQDLLDQGAHWQDSPGLLAQQCDVIITMVGFPKDVEEIYLGENGILSNTKPGSYVIDMTTSSPMLAIEIYEKALARQVFSLDAPVSGGDIGAKEARLSIMVGGSREAFDAMLPLFEKIGTNIVYQGDAGAGQHTKMCNQIAIASNMMGVVEALVYAKKSGLDPSTVLKSIESGAAGSWSLSNLAPRIIAGNFAPGFYVKHFIKDMKIALQSAEEMKVELPGLTLAKSLYEQLAAGGEEDSGTQALFKIIDK
ncbi:MULTISPECIES: NAD(P)-dependent oxidoreductase [unclassified Paenibacillus]|uniref:NAD(P)-dependent oxidoreductase n=1 Tax=unclassified Paenibacillus TaxID=185978 RepID=UPI00278349ED|nr:MULTISPECIES: NAD(P)-dependent oxidoreductase [unclassified Paenibacillus]MDQ0898076.1 3-hydroxyisobutyrate dehydrogenase [Paenibacillus sp. V4I7]MDQ0915918.1 3-hydroxyisobutyrate dehydrogenase [Paenibacillus sp. V4I5]